VVRRLMTDDAYLLQTAVPQWVGQMRDLHRRGVGVRRVLRQLQGRFATLPALQVPAWALHQASLDGPLAEDPVVRSLLRAISFLPQSELATWLAEAEATLSAVPRCAAHRGTNMEVVVALMERTSMGG
jgi:hypothetical protein